VTRAVVVLLLALVAGCGGEGGPAPAGTRTAPTSAPSSTPSSSTPSVSGSSPTAVGTADATASATARPSPTRTRPPRVRGIDASHHQGPIDWPAVAGNGIAFAYLKATEGTGFVDPRFATHRREALDSGVRVGGYHYFQLCSPGAEQAAHFAEVLGEPGRGELPPAVDLELAGSCATPPAREQLLAEVRAFLETLEARTGRRTVVYLYPELEDRYGFAAVLDRRQWVRRLGDAPPARPWWIWQRSQTGSVAGISGGVDLNVMKVR